MIPATYRDVMLDWAVAELMSPHWVTVLGTVWADPVWEPWRDIVRRNDGKPWTVQQSDQLIHATETNRKPILDAYGPRPDWQFWKGALGPDEVAKLNVMPEFFPPGGTVEQLARWIEAMPDYAPEKNAAIVDMTHAAQDQGWPRGSLIVSRRQNGPPVLVEGYKRALLTLAVERSATPVYLCRE